MLFRNPVNLLIAACVTMTSLLGYIQFRLVDNTYQLTRDQYKEEILNRASAELREQGDSINTQALDTLEHMAREYVSQQISRKQFLQQLSRIKPKPGRLIMQYEEIVMVVKGEADTSIHHYRLYEEGPKCR